MDDLRGSEPANDDASAGSDGPDRRSFLKTAGIAGALGAVAVQFVAPDSFNVFLSIVFLVGIVVGGLASISGALYGALFIQFIPNVADEISKAAPWAIFGVVMIGFVYLMPTGVAGAIRLALARRARVGSLKEKTP